MQVFLRAIKFHCISQRTNYADPKYTYISGHGLFAKKEFTYSTSKTS